MGGSITAPPFFNGEYDTMDNFNVTSFLKDIKFKTATVPVPELQEGAVIKIREFSGAEQAALVAMMQDGKRVDDLALAAFIFSKALINEAGEPLLADAEQARALIDKIPARVYNRLNKAIWDLNNGEAEKKV